MAYDSDGFSSYIVRGGKREFINPEKASMKMGDDEVFRFDGKSGLLELSMSQVDIDFLIKGYGGLPIVQMQVPAPFEQPIVQNVKEIRPLPKKDGTFLMTFSSEEPEKSQAAQAAQRPARRGWLRRIFG